MVILASQSGDFARDKGRQVAELRSILFAGQPIDFTSPQAAHRSGVSTIYQ